EVAATLAELRDAGKVREVGVSNHTPAQVAALQAHLPFPLAANQPEYSAAHLDPLRDGTFDACMRDGVTPMAWSPLAGGRLATGAGSRGRSGPPTRRSPSRSSGPSGPSGSRRRRPRSACTSTAPTCTRSCRPAKVSRSPDPGAVLLSVPDGLTGVVVEEVQVL